MKASNTKHNLLLDSLLGAVLGMLSTTDLQRKLFFSY